jgi:hypothetical protein
MGKPVMSKPQAGKDTKVEEKGHNPVQHDGEYVLTPSGSKDFGEISPEIAQGIRRQAGKIRLRIGKQEAEKGNYGEKHIERKERMKELRSNGYENARDFVQDVAGGYMAIYGGESGRLILYKKIDKKGISLFVELMPSQEGDFYDVKTGMITRDTYFTNKKPLWEKSQSG